jgi:hypothetical protein
MAGVYHTAACDLNGKGSLSPLFPYLRLSEKTIFFEWHSGQRSIRLSRKVVSADSQEIGNSVSSCWGKRKCLVPLNRSILRTQLWQVLRRDFAFDCQQKIGPLWPPLANGRPRTLACPPPTRSSIRRHQRIATFCAPPLAINSPSSLSFNGT